MIRSRAGPCRGGRLCLAMAGALVLIPLVSAGAGITPPFFRGREQGEEDRWVGSCVAPRVDIGASPERYFPIDSLELILIGWAPGEQGGEFIAGDTDQDGLGELLGCENNLCRIWENDGSDLYSLQQTLSSTYVMPWDTGDADGDGLPDMVVQRIYVAQLWESPTPESHPSQLVWQSPHLSNVAQDSRIVDLDQDGKREILLTRDGFSGPGDVVIFECRGDNTFEFVYGSRPTNWALGQFAVGDFDQDGWTEFAVGDTDIGVYVYECTGDDSYHRVATLPTGVWNNYYAVEARDMDGNGRAEFVVGGDISASWTGRKWTVFEAIGDDTYTVVDSIKVIDGWHGSARCDVADVDGDGIEELVTKNHSDIRVFKAIDIGTYVQVAQYPEPDWPLIKVLAEDLNSNGYAEIVWAAYLGHQTLIVEDRRAYGHFSLGIATNGTIVPQGGTLSYDGMLVNLEATPETVDVWTEVLLPGGEPFPGNPVLGPVRITLAPNDTLTTHQWHRIPMAAPPGKYTYMGFVSSSYPLPILAADTFAFTVVQP